MRGAVWLALAAMSASPAVAGGEVEAHSDGDTEIVVTATLRPLDARNVPASLGILTASELQDQSIRTFEDLARADPNLQLSAYQGEMQLFIRGIGATTFLGGFESSVAVNLDGVYLGRPTAVAPALFDVERVEILKGPQGTLYGRNSTGGAVNIVTKSPTRDWGLEARLTAGNYGRVDGFSAVSGPVTDNLAFRLAIGTSHHDGYASLHLGRDTNGQPFLRDAEDQHDVHARARLDWAIGPGVTLELAGDYYRADDRAVVFYAAGPGYANNSLFLARVVQGEIGAYRSRTINTSFLPYNRPQAWGLSARLEAQLGSAVLTATSAYRQTRPRNLDDLSGSTVLAESQFKSEDAKQFSQEILLRSNNDGDLHYLVGGSYYRERNRIRNEFFFPYLSDYLSGTGTADCCLLRANGNLTTDSYALFGEIRYRLGRRTFLTLGGRYTQERRVGDNLLDFTGLFTLNQAHLPPVIFNSFTPKVLIEERLGAAGLIYASATKGFKAGGFNVGSAQNTPYAPETIWSYELGAKLRLNSDLTIDVSAFHYAYSDLQVQDVDQNNVLIRNAASARVDGLEFEAAWRPSQGLRLGVSGSNLHARFSRYETVNTKTPQLGLLDLSGNPLPQSPRWRMLGHAEYDLLLAAWGQIRLRGDASWQDRVYFSAFKDPRSTQAGYWWLKARATFLPKHGRYQVAAFVDNLTDTSAFTNISITGDLDASRALGNMAPPRTWGVALSYEL